MKALFVSFVAIGHSTIIINICSVLKLVKSLRKIAEKTDNTE